MEAKCPFCGVQQRVLENHAAFAIYDISPVNRGRLLFIPIHVHLIPRFTGDTEQPIYGVSGVIPARQKYPQAR